MSRNTLADDPAAAPEVEVPSSTHAVPGGSLLRRAWLRATGRAVGPEPQPSEPGAGPTPDPAEPGAGPDRIAVLPADASRSRRKAR